MKDINTIQYKTITTRNYHSTRKKQHNEKETRRNRGRNDSPSVSSDEYFVRLFSLSFPGAVEEAFVDEAFVNEAAVDVDVEEGVSMVASMPGDQ